MNLWIFQPQKCIRLMFEKCSRIGMADPIFGSLPLRKYQRTTFETSPDPTIRPANPDSSINMGVSPSYRQHSDVGNPLSTNIFIGDGSVQHVSPDVGYKEKLFIAQQELMRTHEEILQLEAELKAARFK